MVRDGSDKLASWNLCGNWLRYVTILMLSHGSDLQPGVQSLT